VANGAPGPQRIAEADLDFVRAAFDLLPAEPWDAATFKAWTEAVKRASGRSGKQLFGPLRLALTGHDHGPALAELLPLMGRESVLARRP
jgi:glutamyl-tRNA synthetase